MSPFRRSTTETGGRGSGNRRRARAKGTGRIIRGIFSSFTVMDAKNLPVVHDNHNTGGIVDLNLKIN